MIVHKILCILWLVNSFSSPVISSTKEVGTSREEVEEKEQVSTEREMPIRLKKSQTVTEKIPDEDDDRKTLAQQVIDGKYGLIQTELFSSPVKRPGIISYEVNPEVPKDNINNLGGLKPEEIWLAENHLLVLKGGGFSEKEQTGKVEWPPIDNYIAPQRQVKIPPNPKIPPPFPIQLKDGGPIELIKGKNSTKTYSPFLNGGPFGPPLLFPLMPPTGSNDEGISPNQGNSTQGDGAPPFPYLPPGLGLYRPAIAFLPPPGNLTELDEDDPRIYYPPKYDFVYKKNYSSHVPPGPLVPGIILPPPPSFFAPLGNSTKVQRPNENDKLTHAFKKLSKGRQMPENGIRHKVISPQITNYKVKLHPSREHKVITPIHVVHDEPKIRVFTSKNSNSSNEEWVPIPAPRPFYISDINKLKALTNNKGDEHSLKYDGPKNGWDYENNTSVDVGQKIEDEFVRMNSFKNSDRDNKKTAHYHTERTEKKLKNIIPQYYTTEKNYLKISVIPQYYPSESSEEKYKSVSIPHYYTAERNEKIQSSTPSQLYTTGTNKGNLKSNILLQYETTEKNSNNYQTASLPHIVANYAFSSQAALTDEDNRRRPIKNKNSQIIGGKLLNPITQTPLQRHQEQYIYEKPFVEINTLIPQITSEVTVKTPPLKGRFFIPSIKYGDEYKSTIKPSSKPSSLLYNEQESKYQADDSGGYSYDTPVNPLTSEKYQVDHVSHEPKLSGYTTTIRPPVYEYSFSAPGYGTLESPKVGNNIVTTPKPVIFEGDFKPMKSPQFTFFEYESSANKNDYIFKQSTVQPSRTTPRAPIKNKANIVKVDPYQTENPYATYTQDFRLLDDITKKYFTMFGQKINPDNVREVTTSVPIKNQNYYDKPYYTNYESVASVTTKAPSSNIRFPEIYNIQSDRPYYETQAEYSTPKYRPRNRTPKPLTKHNEYSYYYSASDPGLQDYKDYDQEVVRPSHPLDSDIAVNYKIPSPNIEPDAEFINPAYLNPAPGNTYISYKLPGNGGHFFFITPQAIQQHNFPPRNSRIRYRDIEKHEYFPRDIRQK